jgi:hypothetical protein
MQPHIAPTKMSLTSWSHNEMERVYRNMPKSKKDTCSFNLDRSRKFQGTTYSDTNPL